MPLPGGPADKVGNRYEGRWVVACLAEVLSEQADAIRLEPPGDEGKGVEFWLRRGDLLEYHQVKRQHDEGRWTLARLDQAGVFDNFRTKLQEGGAKCVFVSMHAADQLDELADRARAAASFEEFDLVFLTAEGRRYQFGDLRHRWNGCLEEEAYEYLRRIWVRTIDERTLRENTEYRLGTLVDDIPAEVAASLSQFALDNTYQELTAHDMWHHLDALGFRRRKWNDDPHVLVAVESANDRYAKSFPDISIGGRVIDRGEAALVFDVLFQSTGHRAAMLVGEAGVGKSRVMRQLVDGLQEQGIPYLALRVDRLEPAVSPENIGRQAGIRGSPAAILAAVAQGRPCALILDQLDAVSLASGRQTALFDAIAELIGQARLEPNMRLVLACRRFDLDNDPRLRGLTGPDGVAEVVPVARLPEGTVREVVAGLGLQADRLTPQQVTLLSVPLHLSLLAGVATDGTAEPLGFSTVTDLYDRFWSHKQTRTRERRGGSVQGWAEIMDALANYMSSHQTLSTPRMVVDDYEDDVPLLVSENVLVKDGRDLSFFHESFFDYVFARRFAARGEDLVAWLRRSEQGLFRRSQVRQILAFDRDEDRGRYLAALAGVLNGPGIRSHLKDVVLALLAELQDPTTDEGRIIVPMLTEGRGFPAWRAWHALGESVPWFDLLDELGLLEEWLAGDDEGIVDRTVRILEGVLSGRADRVAELVEPYLGHSDSWDRRLASLVALGDVGASRRFLDLALRFIDLGVLDTIAAARDFWLIPRRVAEARPDWACEIIGHFLARMVVLTDAAGRSNPFDAGPLSGHDVPSVLLETAQREPAHFVVAVLPFVLEVVERTARHDGEFPILDGVWWARYPSRPLGVSGALLAALEAALRELAATVPDDLQRATAALSESDYDTAQFLLTRAYAANGEAFADVAAGYLAQRPSRLNAGYVNGPYWATRELLASITPHCSDDQLARLEEAILDYYPRSEVAPGDYRFRGTAQLVLLGGFDEGRRGRKGNRRLHELRRKFAMDDAPPPTSMVGGVVESPIGEPGAERMTDGQWLAAVAQHARDDIRLVQGDSIVGGASQLASVMERRATEEPSRFARLALRFPDTTHPAYFDAVLRGVSVGVSSIDPGPVLQLCEHCYALPGRPHGRTIAFTLGRLADAPLPESLLDLLARYATEHPDPDRELWCIDASGMGPYYGGSPHFAGINSARGAAATAIATLINADRSRLGVLRPFLERMVADPSVAVRSCVAEVLTSVLAHDRSLAVDLFVRLCETDDALLGTRTVERFLYYALDTHFEVLRPLLERMLASTDAGAVTVGARQASRASLATDEAREIGLRCLTGAEAQRLGAAEVYAANLGSAALRTVCEEGLVRFFGDPSTTVQAAAAQCFRELGRAELGRLRDLVSAFVASPTFADEYKELLDALEETTADVTDMIPPVAERFLEVAGPDVSDIQTGAAGEADKVARLVVRAYSQSQDQMIRERCLDVVDRMTELGAWELSRAIEPFDR